MQLVERPRQSSTKTKVLAFLLIPVVEYSLSLFAKAGTPCVLICSTHRSLTEIVWKVHNRAMGLNMQRQPTISFACQMMSERFEIHRQQRRMADE